VDFLAIARQVAFKSGTVSSTTLPSAVTGQTGRLAQIVDYTISAWNDIQTAEQDWRWMRTEFTGSVTVGDGRYSGANFSLTRWSRWIFDPNPGAWTGLSLYLTATGVSDETPLTYLPWDEFRRMFLFGTQTNGRPRFFTIGNDVPDGSYTVVGEYKKSPQTLAVDADTPEMPAENHILIVWWALVMLGENDEAVAQDPAWRLRRDAELDKLTMSQLPRLGLGPGSTLA
jgi:hypothetical protein